MADYENRRRIGQGYRRDDDDDRERWRQDDRGYGGERYYRGESEGALRESRRRLEQTGDYDPDMLDDMRRFSGEGPGYREPYSRDTRGYAGERYGRSDHDRGDYGRSDYGRTDYGRSAQGRTDYGRNDRGERGMWDRTSDEVSSWFGDDDAQRRRNQDEMLGHRGRGPRGYNRSDDRIREDVSDRLTDDPYVDASEIDVAVSGCEVTLTGTVDSRSTKRRAEDVAERVSGVRHVQNNLRVRQSSYTGSATAGGAAGMAGLGSGTTSGSTGTSATGMPSRTDTSTDATASARTLGTDGTTNRR